MHENDRVRVQHILDASREAIAFAQGHSRQNLDADRKLNLSLVHLLEIVGEASRGISASFCSKHPEIPWQNMVGMRDRLIHGYFDINLDVVWKTVTEDLPSLIPQLEKVIKQENF